MRDEQVTEDLQPCRHRGASAEAAVGACPRPGLGFEQFDAEAYAHSDNEALAQLYAALEALFLELPYERLAVASGRPFIFLLERTLLRTAASIV